MSNIKSLNIPFNPEIGSVYKYVITKEKKIDQEIEGRKIESPLTSQINLTFKVIQATSKNFIITASIDSFITKNENQKFDSVILFSEPLSKPYKKMIEILNGYLFFLQVDSTGVIKKINNFEKFEDKIDSLINSSKDGKSNSLLVNLYNEQYIKNLFGEILYPLPEIPISEASSYPKCFSAEIDDIIKFTEIYAFSKIENGIAFIKTSANIDQEIKMQNRYPIKMKGIQKGGIEVEEKTGFLLNKESNISLKGNLKTKNINIELSISLYKKIKGKKL